MMGRVLLVCCVGFLLVEPSLSSVAVGNVGSLPPPPTDAPVSTAHDPHPIPLTALRSHIQGLNHLSSQIEALTGILLAPKAVEDEGPKNLQVPPAVQLVQGSSRYVSGTETLGAALLAVGVADMMILLIRKLPMFDLHGPSRLKGFLRPIVQHSEQRTASPWWNHIVATFMVLIVVELFLGFAHLDNWFELEHFEAVLGFGIAILVVFTMIIVVISVAMFYLKIAASGLTPPGSESE